MTGFADASAVRGIGEGRYAAELDLGFTPEISGIVHGGYLLATALRAVLDASPHPDPVATSAHFLRPGAPGPAEIRLEPLRAGRTVSVTRATVVQEGRAILSAQVSTADLGREAGSLWSADPPSMPPVEACVALDPAHPLGPGRRFLSRLDLRLDTGTTGWLDGAPHGVPELRGYFRLPESDRPDACVLALAVDAKPLAPVAVGLLEPASTVELTLHVRGRAAAGWLRLHARTRLIGDDWFDEEVDVWDSAGALVAQSRQLVRRGGRG